jgi:membrane fusion protein, multidrug efflux system
VRAPFDALVTSVAVAQGDRVQPGAAIAQLARSDMLRVQLGIEPASSHTVSVGTKVSLWAINATPITSAPVVATITGIQDVVDPKTQLVSAIVMLPRSSVRQWVPGMKVRALLQLDAQKMVAVPRNAVLTDGRGDYVFQVSEGKAQRVAVQKRLEAGDWVGIDALRNPSLRVVTIGNYELQDGMSVKEIVP